MPTTRPRIYGVMAEFDDPSVLLAAAARAREAGYRRMDAYAPFPVEGLAEALGHRKATVRLFTLLGGLAGGVGGYFMQWWALAVDYPINIRGRQLHSWPAFVPT